MGIDTKAFKKGAAVLVRECGRARDGETLLVISDASTEDVARYVIEAAKATSSKVQFKAVGGAKMHGQEPPREVADAMLKADVIFCLTAFSMAHTKARKRATDRGARYLSLPDYSLEQLASPALTVDYASFSGVAGKLRDILDNGKTVRVRTLMGTDLELNIAGRTANFCPGYTSEPGMLGSPPDIETNIAPLEEKSRGTIVVDGSIPCREIGLVSEAIRVEVKAGNIRTVDTGTEQGRALDTLLRAGGDERRLILAEFGIGLNPQAKLCGRMLEDEGCMGTVHFGFGSNATIGGENDVAFHLDLVIRNPTVVVDGLTVMEEGRLCEPP
ncbi:MAG: hypothetical protein HZB92_04735 [Euryarchaeota archaeon]|nr:hypothetical protein [Euryarchaeota archaeon]